MVMFLSLVLKEFKNGSLARKMKKGNFLGILLNIILVLGFLVLEIYIYSMLNAKLRVFVGASEAFLTLFLFLIGFVNILYLVTKVRATLFDPVDNKIIITKPVSPTINMASKLVFIYLKDVLANLLISLPILIVFGIDHNVLARTFFLMALYPLIISLFETGVAFLLATPYQSIYTYFKNHFIFRLIVSIVMMVILCFTYSYILNLFLSLVRDNNIYAIFSSSTIKMMSQIAPFLMPTRLYLLASINYQYIHLITLVLVSLLVFCVGASLGSKLYFTLMKKELQEKVKAKKHAIVITSAKKALFKKEIMLYFENGSSIFSFGSLLILQPALTVIVVQAMNLIFRTGILTYITNSFTYLLPLIQMLFVALFATFINTISSFVITREKHTGIRICKTIPVSYKEQIFVKMIVPFISSFSVLFITMLILILTGTCSLLNGVFSFLFALVLNFFLEFVSVRNDLKRPSIDVVENNRSVMITLLPVVLSILYVAAMFILNFIGLPYWAAFIIVFGLLLVFTTAYVFYFTKRVSKYFVALEVRN